MKRCTGKCHRPKPRREFNKNRRRADGLNSICRSCSRERSKRYYREHGEQHRRYVAERKKRIVAENRLKAIEYLLAHPCVDCGEPDIVVLDFDHVRGKKWKVISHLINSACRWSVILKEIKKCEVRCANCHRRKTARQRKYYRFGAVTQRSRVAAF